MVSVPLDIAFMMLNPYLAPIKAFAKKYAGGVLKGKISGPLMKLIRLIGQKSSSILNVVKKVVTKIPIWGKGWGSKINVASISAKIAGGATSLVFNTVLNLIVPNITIFLSPGGFIAGVLDILSDKRLNNKITIPFVWR